ncbi:MAG TPA: AAA family ATPase [Polyangiaceae bacterium]|nr:MAG: Trifunctional NAD biosynthesis/regulator protein NadR [Deltaproteobacteria bacterium ADurb.Bin207]HNS97743.1 AAA family ATPase [Polyangiaceae bacterium]HNZ22771.1 AAA family ATPase [Polyangiaceae bacterium]HOD22836.1 AAA family ATPase [Polyangiaceae bacterium]HOE47669.1 AAA family ATPase [Polyangiaceae bacterium]
MKIGLTLGKFSPLHKGHQFLIETALGEVDKLYLLLYDSPETTTIPLSVRAGWVRRMYPQVQVVEAWDGPSDAGYTPEVIRIQDTFVLSHFHDKNITHFYSSERYGEHVSKALRAVNRVVDRARRKVPISGTQIRENPYAARQYLSDVVYRDLIVNVVLMGAPSTGKTVLAEYLAQRFHTVWMPEYGREYWDAHQIDRRLTQAQLVEIAEGHLEREERQLLRANRYLFTDTNALTTRLFSYHYHGTADPTLEALADRCASRYDLYCVCVPDFPYVVCPDRSGEGSRLILQKQCLADLHCRKIPYLLVAGSVAERADQIARALEGLQKYTNPWRLG